MTKKQHQILQAALHLFSEEGYRSTSTSKVSKKADVSEGLIFRHFKNKEGLLESILKEVNQRIYLLFIPIINEEDPKQILSKTLEIPFCIEGNDLKYWKLNFKLKWELENQTIETFNPIKKQLIKAFEKLRYRNPEQEADYLIQHLNGLTAAIIKNTISDKKLAKEFLLRKYHI